MIIKGKFKFDTKLTEYSIIVQEEHPSLAERTLMNDTKPFPVNQGQVYVCVHGWSWKKTSRTGHSSGTQGESKRIEDQSYMDRFFFIMMSMV